MDGLKAFREAYVTSGQMDQNPMQFGTFSMFEARRTRYEIYWAFFENTAYRDLRSWATKYKIDYGLYKYIRAIYNPAYRLGSFWQSHLMGGQLDPEAGDGSETPSALPIDTDHAALRPAIAQLWEDSNWQVKKDVLTLWGALCGDVFMKVVDDTKKRKAYMQVVHPGTMRDVTLDAFGNIKGYVIEEVRWDPRVKYQDVVQTWLHGGQRLQTVVYHETAEREGDSVVFKTYLNGTPYAWDDDAGAEWSMPYGFVPMVGIKHNDIGLDWGWSEIHPGSSKFREADDLASKLGDQIRKHVEAPWLFSGVTAPKGGKITAAGEAPGTLGTVTKKDPGREEVPIFYASDPNAKATPLVAPLDIPGALAHIKEILNEMERDYPELKADELKIAGRLSGRALELAQQPAADKVLQRRPNYDKALIRVQQMAIAIGGFQGYDGFEGFSLDSYQKGDLDYSFGKRDVFHKTQDDLLENQLTLWQGASLAVASGAALRTFLRKAGWSDADIEQMDKDLLAEMLVKYKLAMAQGINDQRGDPALLTEGQGGGGKAEKGLVPSTSAAVSPNASQDKPTPGDNSGAAQP